MVARFGGDEFALLPIAGSTVADALAIAQRIITSLELPFQIHGTEVIVGCSAGVSAVRPGTAVDEVLRDALCRSTFRLVFLPCWYPAVSATTSRCSGRLPTSTATARRSLTIHQHVRGLDRRHRKGFSHAARLRQPIGTEMPIPPRVSAP